MFLWNLIDKLTFYFLFKILCGIQLFLCAIKLNFALNFGLFGTKYCTKFWVTFNYSSIFRNIPNIYRWKHTFPIYNSYPVIIITLEIHCSIEQTNMIHDITRRHLDGYKLKEFKNIYLIINLLNNRISI